MTGLMMPSILPTTTSGLSLWAAATPTTSASATTCNANSARTARMPLHRRQLAGDRLDLGPQALEGGFIGGLLGDRADDLSHALHVGLRGAAGRHRRRPEAHAAGHGRPAGLARVVAVEQLDDQQVVISSARDDLHAASDKSIGQRAGVVDDLLLVAPEF